MLLPVSTEEEDFTIVVNVGKEKSRYVYDDGDYQARITKLEESVSQAGNKQIIFYFTGTSGAAQGIDFRTYVPLKLGWKLEQIMTAVGVTKAENGDLPVSKKNTIGKAVTLTLAAREKDGRTFMEVEFVGPPEAAQATGARPF